MSVLKYLSLSVVCVCLVLVFVKFGMELHPMPLHSLQFHLPPSRKYTEYIENKRNITVNHQHKSHQKYNTSNSTNQIKVLRSEYVAHDNVMRNDLDSRPVVAVCTLSRSTQSWKNFKQSDLYRFFLKSVYETTRESFRIYDIALHVGVNDNDHFFVNRTDEAMLVAAHEFGMNLTFYKYKMTEPDTLPMNSLMQDAANTGAHYLVRLNDDTEIMTKGWIPYAVAKLRSFSPPNIGVVGPICKQGNTRILTHDMVHRKHLDIFGSYYPKILKNWYIDDWISTVYGPSRTSKLMNWVVIHHVEGGTRYKPTTLQHKLLKPLIVQGEQRINKYLHAVGTKNIISYSLYGTNSRYIVGAIENANNYKKIFPGWNMRVYYDSTVPMETIEILRKNDVELWDMSTSKINKMSWRFSISDNVTRFCSRDIDSRLSKREKLAVDAWITSGKTFHVMRDHPSHSKYAMSGGMWCTTSNGISKIQEIQDSLPGSNAYLKDMDWLNKNLWPIARKDILQHDSFSCNEFGGGFPFPSVRIGWEHVGSVYIDGKMRTVDVDILKAAKIPESCREGDSLHALGEVDYITNHKYDSICDVAYKTRSRNDLKFPLTPGSIICTQGTTDILKSFFKLNIQVPFTLVTIESDEDITSDHTWIQNRFLIQWYSWNSVHPSIIPIPIGLNHNTQFMAIRESDVYGQKVEKVLLNFKLDRQERQEIYSHFENKAFIHIQKYERFWETKSKLKRHYQMISRFKWVLCPRGEGHDTHRVWETLYLGSTPVVLKGPLYNLYSQFPIIQIDTWRDLSLNKLLDMQNSILFNETTSKLIFSYWYNLIRNSSKQSSYIMKQHTQKKYNSISEIQLNKTHNRTVVMAAAMGYNLVDFERFIIPLRKVYDGAVVLFGSPRGASMELCRAQGVQLRDLPKESSIGVRANRFVGYEQVCSEYDWCLGVDFRDVFFQSNPFQSMPNGNYELILTHEFKNIHIKDCPYNRGWLGSCWGDAWVKGVGHENIICSGTIMGTPLGFQMLRTAMLAEMALSASKGRSCTARDQGHLNYIYLSHKLDHSVVHMQEQGHGIFNTVGYITPRSDIVKHLDEDGLIKNYNGVISPVVHQYDRFPELGPLIETLRGGRSVKSSVKFARK